MDTWLDTQLFLTDNSLGKSKKPEDVRVSNIADWVRYYFLRDPTESRERYEDRLDRYTKFYTENLDIFNSGVQDLEESGSVQDLHNTHWIPREDRSWLDLASSGHFQTEVLDSHRDPIIRLPGHKYAGPGNSIDSGATPIDVDDRLAYNHDIDYSKAKTPEDVREADREFILESVNNALTGDIHSAINAVGIGTKYVGESITGVKYPSLSGKLWQKRSFQ